MNLIWAALIGYVVGGIPTGIWITRAVKGMDPRAAGSGGSGATNVSRVLGRKWAVIVLVLDTLKGLVPTLAVTQFFPATDQPLAGVIVGAAAVLGHVFTPFAGFRGGKGVATSAGVMLAIDPTSLGLAALVWAVFFAAMRIVSVASLAAVISLPLIIWFAGDASPVVILFSAALGLFIIFTHRGNIQRLLARKERPIV
ncbi:glycerol-3-phosphate 1-O-acyltransferase PlsY [candidate division KSB1 bacterium]|nr:glycerol-3-phosphate 1-O-acyltransferase PlsY [candidate division KSB1 bacterium]